MVENSVSVSNNGSISIRVEEAVRLPKKPNPRMAIPNGSLEVMDAGTFINSALGIVDGQRKKSDFEIIQEIYIEAEAHKRTNQGLIAQSLDELIKTIEESDDQSYLPVVRKTADFIKKAGLLPEDYPNA